MEPGYPPGYAAPATTASAAVSRAELELHPAARGDITGRVVGTMLLVGLLVAHMMSFSWLLTLAVMTAAGIGAARALLARRTSTPVSIEWDANGIRELRGGRVLTSIAWQGATRGVLSITQQVRTGRRRYRTVHAGNLLQFRDASGNAITIYDGGPPPKWLLRRRAMVPPATLNALRDATQWLETSGTLVPDRDARERGERLALVGFVASLAAVLVVRFGYETPVLAQMVYDLPPFAFPALLFLGFGARALRPLFEVARLAAGGDDDAARMGKLQAAAGEAALRLALALELAHAGADAVGLGARVGRGVEYGPYY